MIKFFKKKELTDDEIIIKILDWKKEYFSLLTKKYEPKLTSYLMNMFQVSSDQCEDYIQDIFIKIWKNLDKYEINTNFNAWVYKIAYRETINMINKNKELSTLPDYWLNIEDETPDSITIVNEKFKKDILSKMLLEMKEDVRTAIILYHQEWKSYEEIGEILWKPKWTIWSMIARGKQRLKEMIENTNFENNKRIEQEEERIINQEKNILHLKNDYNYNDNYYKTKPFNKKPFNKNKETNKNKNINKDKDKNKDGGKDNNNNNDNSNNSGNNSIKKEKW